MDDNNKSEIASYITKRMEEIYSKIDSSSEALTEIEENKDYFVQLLVDEYAREKGMKKIRKLSLANFTNITLKELSSRDNPVITKNMITEILLDYLEPIRKSFFIFLKAGDLYRGELAPLLSPELSEVLNELHLKNDFNIVTDFTNELKQRIAYMEKELKEAEKTDKNKYATYDQYLQIFKNILFAQVHGDSLDDRYNSEALREFATSMGLISNDLLISMQGIPAKQLHNLIDVDALLDKLENGTITKREEKHIFPIDYAERYLYYYKNGEPEKAKQMLSHLNPQDIAELFRKHQLDIDIMITIYQEMINSGIRSSKIREATKTLMQHDKKDDKKISNLTPTQVLKLVKANLLSDECLMIAYFIQEEMIKEDPSIKLYPEKYALISKQDIKEQFTPARLLKHYFNASVIDKTIYFYHTFIFPELSDEEKDNFDKQLLANEQLTPGDIVILFKEYDLLQKETFIKLKESNPEIQQEYYEYIKKANLRDIFGEVENGLITEEELIEIFDDKYYDMVREAISHACISLTCIDKITFLDADMVIDEYHKEIEGKEEFNPEDESFDFRDMVIIYLGSRNLINISHIIQFIEENKDPMFHTEDFNLSRTLYERIVGLDKSCKEIGSSIDMTSQIRELYLNGLLTFDELAKLTEEGIISSENAQKINKEYCDKEMIAKLKEAKLGGSLENEPTTNGGNRVECKKISRRQQEKEPTKESLVSQQNDVMLEILKQYGFEPITTETNAYGYSEIQSFRSGNFEDYMVLLSEEIPEVAILMHSKHVQNSDIYYQTGGNATYILSTAKLKTYLEQVGALESKYSHLAMTKQSMKTDDPYLRTANVTKKWGKNVARKIYEVLHMLEQPSLEEQSTSMNKPKTSSFKPEAILPIDLSDAQREERLVAIEMFNEELKDLKEQIENDENHGI